MTDTFKAQDDFVSELDTTSLAFEDSTNTVIKCRSRFWVMAPYRCRLYCRHFRRSLFSPFSLPTSTRCCHWKTESTL